MSAITAVSRPVCSISCASRDMRFLAKKSVFQIPLVRFALRTMGMIEVDRTNPEAAAASIDHAVAEIISGKCIVLFSEGTRSRIDGLLPFKKAPLCWLSKRKLILCPSHRSDLIGS